MDEKGMRKLLLTFYEEVMSPVLDEILSRLKTNENTIGRIETKVDGLEIKVGSLKKEVAVLSDDVSVMGVRLGNVEKKVDILVDEMFDTKDNHGKRIENLERVAHI